MGLATLFDIFPPVWEHNLVYGVGMLSITSYIAAGFEAYGKHHTHKLCVRMEMGGPCYLDSSKKLDAEIKPTSNASQT